MGEARTAELWLRIDQLHLRFLQVSWTKDIVIMESYYVSAENCHYFVPLIYYMTWEEKATE